MNMKTEVWTVCGPLVGKSATLAKTAEEQGWDGITFGDSQNRAGDSFVEMALAAVATTRFRIATWVTNPVTRHPAVVAGAIATLQEESGGRMELGIGRGDSALAYLGLAPASVDFLKRYLIRLQGYLSGQAVPFDPEDAVAGVRPVASIELGSAPTASRLEWLSPEFPKVPVFLAATGPRVIQLSAQSADAVVFSVGSDPARLRWAIEIARSAREALGGDPDDLVFGAHVPIAVHDDPSFAEQLVSSKVAVHARIAVMHGQLPGPSTATLDADLATLRTNYDMNHHATHGTRQTAVLTDEVIRTWGIAGPSSYCVERLLELKELGITKFLLNNTFPGSDPADELASRLRLVETVIPSLRDAQ
jgi:5,10-methylenetetrahydromethanopterin reductase